VLDDSISLNFRVEHPPLAAGSGYGATAIHSKSTNLLRHVTKSGISDSAKLGEPEVILPV